MSVAPTIAGISRTYRHMNRYRQVLAVLFRYGFGEMVDRLHIHHYLDIGLQLISRQKRESIETLTTSQRVRMILEELGPTFVKLGQVLSTRPDLIPAELAEELRRLQQSATPFDFAELRQIVERELGQPLSQAFATFNETPLAAASIGQVHRATLPGGEQVVVKVRRPGITEKVRVDLEILGHLAELAERNIEAMKIHQPSRVVEEFARVITRELDFTIEAAHVERFAAQFRDDETIRVPRVYRQAVTPEVLTLEYMPVISILDAAELRRQGLDPRELAARGVRLTLRQIFVLGFFHADPHPGNIFALPGNVVCLLDFGMMGRIDQRGREDFADLIHAVAVRDAGAAVDALLRLTQHGDSVDVSPRELERDLAELIDVNVVGAMKDVDFAKLLADLMTLTARHRLSIPADMVTMLKAAATVESLVAGLDPELNVIEAAAPYVRRLKLDRYRPRRVMRELMSSGGDVVRMARDIPGSVRDLLRLAKRGTLRMGFEHRGLDTFMESNERIANRISFAIVVAALIIGSSLIVHSRIPPRWHDIPVVGLIGFIVAGWMGMLLMLGILRHGRL